MKKYTVILVYPDYVSDAGNHETWCGTVAGHSIDNAIENAQKECAKDNAMRPRPDDLLPIAIFEGEHEDRISDWSLAR